nr:alkaline phosphatase family protein [Lentibacillus sp. JNUCC-1]
MLNIDSLMPYALEQVAQTGRAPALQFLMENGMYFPDMVSSFPTMSVTIDSTLLTGTYPDQHQIPGLHWFDINKKQFVNYGTGFRETFRIGMRRSIHNMLYRLNHEHLSKNVTTIYEDLAHKNTSSASINSFVYRGNHPQRLKTPKLLSALTHFEDGEWIAETPTEFSLGAFSKFRSKGVPTQVAAGNYKYTAKELRHLIKTNKLPQFTFCIFQDMDTRLHFKGPTYMKMILKIDNEIQKILNMYPSWKEALYQNIWMVIGDNGHSATGTRRRKHAIDLRKIFKRYRIARLQKSVTEKDQLVLCVNQRMAFIYLLDKKASLDSLVALLKKDKRIDVIAWKRDGAIHVVSGIKEGTVSFRPNGPVTDIYDQTWYISGNLDILDLHVTNHQFLTFGNYPDALARLYGALHSHSGTYLVVNAKPGYEFKAQATPAHLSGAAHGSLHRQESLVPLLVAGTNKKPAHRRFTDMKNYILNLC